MTDAPQNDVEDDGSGFDPIIFARKVYESIEPFRSEIPSSPSQLIESPPGAKASFGENRVNAFFRLIGLPAARDEETVLKNLAKDACEAFKGNQAKRNRAFSQDGTLNYFGSGITKEQNSAIASRNTTLTKTAKPEDFNTMFKDPLAFDSSVEGNSPRRAALFPLIVDASVPIYPIDRRMAPAFNDGDYLLSGGKTRLSRPFLEHIIYIRSRVIAGDSGSTTREELVERVNALRNPVEEALAEAGPPVPLTDVANFSTVELIVNQRFIQALKKLAFDYNRTVAQSKQISQKIKFTPQPVSNPEERGGQSNIVEPTVGTETTDIKIKQLKIELAKEESLLFILPTEEITRSDNLRRLEDQISVKNFKDDVLISNFTELLTYPADALREEVAKAEDEKKRDIQKAERLKRDLLYYTGEFTGLSIFDIISVLYGLFTVELNILIGLLNPDSQQRLANNPFFAESPGQQSASSTSINRNPTLITGANSPTVGASLTALEDKIKEAFLIANTFAKEDDRTMVRQRSARCRTT